MAATAAAAAKPRRPASPRRAILALALFGAIGAAIVFLLDDAVDWSHDPRMRSVFVLTAAGIILAATGIAIAIVARRVLPPVELAPAQVASDPRLLLLESALSQINQGLCVLDPQHRVAIVNHRFAEMFGVPEPWLRSGLKFSEAASLSGIAIDETPLALPFVSDSDQPQHVIHPLADGRIIEIDSRPLANGGRIILFSDVSERERKNEELRTARAQAESAGHAEAGFLANMSHELRTPLNAIIGFTDVMAKEMFGPLGHANYRSYVEDIQTSSRHLLQIITDILQMAKLEAGHMALRESVVDLNAVAAFCWRIVRERAAAGNLHLIFEIPRDMPRLRADERLVKQILLNLLSNAVKYTPPHGTITVSGEVDANGDLTLAVRDTGIGIAAKDMAKALAPFGQVDNAYTRRHSGTGLGLPIVKSYAELHDAAFDIESQVTVGTCVRIRFPAARVVGAGNP